MSETNKATFVIVAPNNYDVKKYNLGVYNNFNKDTATGFYVFSELEFEFNQTDEDGNFVAIVEYKSKEPLKNPGITLFNETIDESKKYKSRNAFQDNKHLPFTYLDNNESDNDNNKSQIFKIELCESHETTLQKMYDNKLCYEYWTEDQLNKCKGNLSKNESNIGQQDQIEQTELIIEEEEEEAEENIQNTQNDQSSKATENNKILLNIVNRSKSKHVNALLLNGEIHFLDNQNDKIYLDKNKEYKIEPVYYDDEKQKFYYFPKSYVCKFNIFHNNDSSDSSIQLNIENEFELYFRYDIDIDIDIDIKLDKNPIYHENQANTELSFGAIFTAGIIICSIFLGIGMLAPIIAGPLIAGCTILATVLFGKGGYDNSKIYTPPKENKSQKLEPEYSDEANPTLNPDFDNPIWTEENPLFNGSDSENGQPPTDPFHNDFEEYFG